jgi:2-polyprenyl-3-methyl-5-hydroxy-6-metoxy-1,4-benzoquinol methylase
MARNKFKLTVNTPETLFELPGKSFEVITLWHVLEHLPNLNSSMSQFFKLLKDTGTLVIAVPNINSYDAKKYQQYWAAYDVPRHLWHFSPNTVSLLAEQCGFQIIDIKPMPFDAFYVSMLSEKYKNKKFATLRGLYRGLLSCFICLFNKKKSSSLIYVMKKAIQTP